MRWIHKTTPKCGDIKFQSKFLFFPKRIGLETRWLEFAFWEEHYGAIVKRPDDKSKYMYTGIYKWRPTEWLGRITISEWLGFKF
jgi:hypothetical protein